MKPFTTLKAIAIPLDKQHVDTDCIIPARFMRKARSEFGAYVFNDLRFDGDGGRRDFVFNEPAYAKAKILVADINFGCGSSRESAVWALAEHDGRTLKEGIRCVVAASFGDIFFSNCCKNGVLPVVLPQPVCAQIRDELRADLGATVTVNLPDQTVTSPSGAVFSFEIAPDRKHRLVRGLDDISITESHRDEIREFEGQRARTMPWLATSSS